MGRTTYNLPLTSVASLISAVSLELERVLNNTTHVSIL